MPPNDMAGADAGLGANANEDELCDWAPLLALAGPPKRLEDAALAPLRYAAGLASCALPGGVYMLTAGGAALRRFADGAPLPCAPGVPALTANARPAGTPMHVCAMMLTPSKSEPARRSSSADVVSPWQRHHANQRMVQSTWIRTAASAQLLNGLFKLVYQIIGVINILLRCSRPQCSRRIGVLLLDPPARACACCKDCGRDSLTEIMGIRHHARLPLR
jgi:hypothetical protein